MPGLSRNERAAVALADWRRTEASMPKLFGREPSLTRRFVWHFRRQLLQQELWLVVNVLGQFSVPLLLKLLLDAIASAQPTHVAYSLAGLSLLGTIIEAVANQRAQLIARGMAQRTTSIASALVVLSTLSASSSAVGQDLGRASNLISSDAERMARVAFRIYLLSYAPLLFLVSVSWLFYILGPAALFAVRVRSRARSDTFRLSSSSLAYLHTPDSDAGAVATSVKSCARRTSACAQRGESLSKEPH